MIEIGLNGMGLVAFYSGVLFLLFFVALIFIFFHEGLKGRGWDGSIFVAVSFVLLIAAGLFTVTVSNHHWKTPLVSATDTPSIYQTEEGELLLLNYLEQKVAPRSYICISQADTETGKLILVRSGTSWTGQVVQILEMVSPDDPRVWENGLRVLEETSAAICVEEDGKARIIEPDPSMTKRVTTKVPHHYIGEMGGHTSWYVSYPGLYSRRENGIPPMSWVVHYEVDEDEVHDQEEK